MYIIQTLENPNNKINQNRYSINRYHIHSNAHFQRMSAASKSTSDWILYLGAFVRALQTAVRRQRTPVWRGAEESG